MWDAMITESRMLPTQAMTDASDLVLRMGRLVWDDPHWAPARSRRAPLRDPAALAPGTARSLPSWQQYTSRLMPWPASRRPTGTR